jgi:hypothetical protein
LNYAAGLEDSIIRIVMQPWNGARSAPPAGGLSRPSLAATEHVEATIAELPSRQSAAVHESESAHKLPLRIYLGAIAI